MIFTSRDFWCLAPLATISQASFLSIQGLWSGPWLTHVGQLHRTEVADILFWVAVSMIAGFVSIGSLAERLSRIGISVATTAVSGMTLFMVVQVLLIIMPVSYIFPLWLTFGFFGTACIVSYSALSQSFPVNLSGRVTTAINLLVFISAFTAQWAIGAIIGLWSNQSDGALSPTGFHTAFSLLLFLQFAGLIYYLWSKRTRKNKTEIVQT